MALTNKQYDSIIRTYEKRQIAHQHELREHLNQVREQLP